MLSLTPLSLSYAGPLGALNEALANLAYTPAPDWNGVDVLAVAVDDAGAAVPAGGDALAASYDGGRAGGTSTARSHTKGPP